MQFCRLYTGNDGKSHFEELDQAESSKHFSTAAYGESVGFQKR